MFKTHICMSSIQLLLFQFFIALKYLNGDFCWLKVVELVFFFCLLLLYRETPFLVPGVDHFSNLYDINLHIFPSLCKNRFNRGGLLKIIKYIWFRLDFVSIKISMHLENRLPPILKTRDLPVNWMNIFFWFLKITKHGSDTVQ